MSLQRSAPLKRTAMKRRWRDTGPSEETKQLLEVRSRGLCELCICVAAVHTHHRLPRAHDLPARRDVLVRADVGADRAVGKGRCAMTLAELDRGALWTI